MYRLFILLLIIICVRISGEEIFFDLSEYFNARVLATDADRTGGMGFEGSKNGKCLNPPLSENRYVTTQDTTSPSRNMAFRTGPIDGNNTILLKNGEKAEIILHGEPALTMFGLLYFERNFPGGIGNVTVKYTDGTVQTIEWHERSASGTGSCSYPKHLISKVSEFEYVDSTSPNPHGFFPLYIQLFPGLDPTKTIHSITLDMGTFKDAPKNAEWAIFGLTGNGELTKTTPKSIINSNMRHYLASVNQKHKTSAVESFEMPDNWQIKAAPGKKVYLSSTQEKPLFNDRITRLEINAENVEPLVLTPRKEIYLPDSFDAMSLYVYSDGYVYTGFPNALQLSIILAGDNGSKTLSFTLNFSGWFNLLYNFSAKELATLGGKVKIESLKLSGYNKGETRIAYFSDLAFFTNKKQLAFQKQPKRNIKLLPGADPGVNIGDGYLPFPTRDTTILPLNFAKDFKNYQTFNRQNAVFKYEGTDCQITYTYTPKTGRLDDITCEMIYPDGFKRSFIPAKEGGFKFFDKSIDADSARLLALRKEDGRIIAEWEYQIGGEKLKGIFRFKILQKSLIVDTLAMGGSVSQVTFGKSIGISDAKLIPIPFYNYNMYNKYRPSVAAAGDYKHPLFYAAHVDWYLSNASEPFSFNSTANDEIISNGGVRYNAKTDGSRNNCAERFFLNVSPDFEETLPQLANPISPWREYTYNHFYFTWAPPPANFTIRKFEGLKRGGIKNIVFRLHHDENLTTHTTFNPSRGGDAFIHSLVEGLQDKRDIRLGPYVDFTDIYPANPSFSIDDLSVGLGGQYEKCWPGAYTRKPLKIAETAGLQAKALKDKFHFKMIYGDVQTAIPPWGLVDYDSRVPGAGTFAQSFYSYGQSFEDMKKNIQGPFYSEGMFHSFYTGITDGDYGHDRGYRTAINPWLVNYNLRALHDVGAGQGMGMLYQFMAGCGYDFNNDRETSSDTVDRLIAATLIFGHSPIHPIGTLTGSADWRMAFMAMPIISEHAKSSVERIEYADENGKWLSTSQAVLSGDYTRSHVLARYKNGVVIVVNGSKEPSILETEVDGVKLLLPRNGYAAWNKDKSIMVYSGFNEEHRRFDYAETPELIYIDGRGSGVFQRVAAADGPAVLHRISSNEFEYIPFLGGFGKDYKTALHKEQMSVGLRMKIDSVYPVKFDRSRLDKKVSFCNESNYTWINLVPDAYSYIIKGTLLTNYKEDKASRHKVYAGESFEVNGQDGKRQTFSVPVTTRPGAFFRCAAGVFIVESPFEFSEAVGKDSVQLIIKCRSLFHLNKKAVCIIDNKENAVTFDQDGVALISILADLKAGERKTTAGCFRCGNFEREFTIELHNEIRPHDYIVFTDKNLVFSATPRESTGVISSLSGEVAVLNAIHGSKDDSVNFAASGAGMSSGSLVCNKIEKRGLGLQVPYKNCNGGFVSQTSGFFTVPVDSNPRLKFSCGKRDSAGNNGDGMQYIVTLTEKDNGVKHLLFDKIVENCEWLDADINLSPWKGKTITLRFVCDSRKDCSCDYGALSYPVVTDVRQDNVLTAKLNMGTVNTIHSVVFTFPPAEKWAGSQGTQLTKDGLAIRGSGYLISGIRWTIDPAKTYRLCGSFKASVKAPQKSNYFFFGLSCNDSSNQYIHPAMINTVDGTETTLKKAANAGDTQIEIADNANWILNNGRVAFNVKTDYSDLPNHNIVPIKAIDGNTITLSKPLEKSYHAGTAVREHRTSDNYMYCFQKWPLSDENWADVKCVVSGESLYGITKDKFWHGTRSVQAIMLTDQQNVLFKDIRLEEVE